jgi:hypothetical protein
MHVSVCRSSIDLLKDLYKGDVETSTLRDPEHDVYTLCPGLTFKHVPSPPGRADTETPKEVWRTFHSLKRNINKLNLGDFLYVFDYMRV